MASSAAAAGPAPPPTDDDTAAAAAAPPPPTLSPPQTSALLSSFAAFLTISLHTLLRHRRLYPPETFLLATAYNLPVYQSRHPDVCAWVRDAVAAALPQLRHGAVRALALVVHHPHDLAVAERWVFDLSGFPREDLDQGRGGVGGGGGAAGGGSNRKGKGVGAAAEERRRRMVYGGWGDDDDAEGAINWADVNEALRGALRRIAYAAETTPPPPEGCTFTLAIELHDEAPAPIAHPQLWIPSQPDLQPPTPRNPSTGSALGGSSTTPIRAVQAGPLFFECWYEQGKEEDKAAASTQDSDAMGDSQFSMYR
ncbi:HORMA domain-containing protein [Purpureocillium lilacinum]|uniref:HORMA domain-containing protein n=1 Tax=Purpureocillium lilacinum TaxID=33203 RepID=A0A179HDG0_PURLI|nr:HORMA domain-containing protein [Purpureocillium lilacinum]